MRAVRFYWLTAEQLAAVEQQLGNLFRMWLSLQAYDLIASGKLNHRQCLKSHFHVLAWSCPHRLLSYIRWHAHRTHWMPAGWLLPMIVF